MTEASEKVIGKEFRILSTPKESTNSKDNLDHPEKHPNPIGKKAESTKNLKMPVISTITWRRIEATSTRTVGDGTPANFPATAAL